jgi:simple sugar transport system permease protein
MTIPENPTRFLILKSILAAILGLLVGGLFVFFTGTSPLVAYKALLNAAFGCKQLDNCAWWTTLQFATPLIFTGLSAAVAFRAGIFSLGQIGQMLLGAAVASSIGFHHPLPRFIHPLVTLLFAASAGAIWGMIPGVLKVILGMNEIIVTIVMNSIAIFIIGFIRLGWGRVLPTARLTQLAGGTKLNTGFLLALGALVLIYFLVWRSRWGYEHRMAGQAPFFASYGGLNRLKLVLQAMALSGALAGIAGAIEVMGVHYRFITNFSSLDYFDGVIVALLGQSHPVGILFAAVYLGGVRLGALNGLLIQAGIPRELGGAMISIMLLFMCADRFFREFPQRVKPLTDKVRLRILRTLSRDTRTQ